ncbi:uncharacterized protein LOC109534640 [Dendroctonus ponderosae]|uniref:uncharacterized protein LOC109534640 n=1 Tax=Dendroctonus ponderosae TaxID=77166 RepID=UPI0020353370|nr:uncharacterized protein LOC109534640 [Dendroctonus ponderosae]KAH1012780.1 hypothetical protein HUJ05_011876 [Dendroctonus ponderosae]
MSTHESHMLTPQKPKLSPLELRNTDLVSRLLAATPPYMYNMQLLPNTYFFSEMLRSLVQAKNEQRASVSNGFSGNNMFYGQPHRRSRKRAWNSVGRETYTHSNHTLEDKVIEKPKEKPDNGESWMLKSMRRNEDNALELTTNGSCASNQKLDERALQKSPKSEDLLQTFPQPQQESSSSLILPPPPPIWYPPIYPTAPYGIDPLHFFIDLRVSGHIYDRQNNSKEGGAISSQEGGNSTIVSQPETNNAKKDVKPEEISGNMFSPKRHCSAFSVPNANRTQTKFDVKSMGFDKSSNKTSTHYIMANVTDIYKNLGTKRDQFNYGVASRSANINDFVPAAVDTEEQKNHVDVSDESEPEKQKKVKDLRALIGLELVVDYMAHKKGLVKSDESSDVSEEGEVSSEVESCGSPQLEVVAVHDEV